MQASDQPSEPPEEPQLRSEPRILSPTSPKPVHFPTPTNIPVLNMQMDVGFNQTEAHMSDPATHNTDIRADFWRDPNEQVPDPQDVASPFSTGGGDAADGQMTASDGMDAVLPATVTHDEHVGNEQSESVVQSNDASHQTNGLLDAEATIPTDSAHISSSDSSVPDAEPIVNVEEVVIRAEEVATEPTTAPAFDNKVQSLVQAAPLPIAEPATPIQAQPTETFSPSSHPPPAGLPPRPPPQEQPLINPNYVHSQHIRDYHPHAAHPAAVPYSVNSSARAATGNVADPAGRNYVPAVPSPVVASTGATDASTTSGGAIGAELAPGQFAAAAGPGYPTPVNPVQVPGSVYVAGVQATPAYPFQTPANASYPPPYTNTTPIESRRELKIAAGETPTAEERPWDAETQKKYDRFIEEERGYVSEGRWEQFVAGSRLFVGNLSSEKVTKRDIFHVFHGYGELAQISIKQAYGFVQFLRMDDCVRALEGEQGTLIRDKRIHLEVSKPQKNRPQANNQQNNNNTNSGGRRSRSPDFGRGKPAPNNVDRYVSGGGSGARNGGRNSGGRDAFRPASGNYRSPSPQRGGGNYRDRNDDRFRPRSRSPPSYSNNRGGSRNYRSPSPRRNTDDDLPLPRRPAHEVPDVQILALEPLERDFLAWVESAFTSRSVRVDVLILSPRLNEQAVVRRQIVEGVVAVVKLTRANMQSGKIGLQIFDRRGGAEVRFEEYEGLDPPICAELVLRAKPAPQQQAPTYGSYSGAGQYAAPQPPQQQQQHQYGGYQPQPSSQYVQPAYAQPPPPQAAYAPPPQATQQQQQHPNLQNLISSLDPAGLQNLLSAMNQKQPATYAAPAPAYAATGAQFGQQQQQAMAALQRDPGLVAGALQQQQQQGGAGVGQAPGQSAGATGGVNMQDILARLGTYRQ